VSSEVPMTRTRRASTPTTVRSQPGIGQPAPRGVRSAEDMSAYRKGHGTMVALKQLLVS